MLVTSKELLQKAKEEGFAVPSANFNDLNSLRWLISTAEELNLPLIVSLAEAHLGDNISLEDAAQVGRLLAQQANVPIVLHLDHGTTPETIKKAVDLGFTSVMIDKSEEPLEENIKQTKEIVDYAHDKGVTVEGEIGHVGTAAMGDKDSIYTSVDEALEYADKSGIDSIAVSIGTAHGLYKGTPKINFERLKELNEALDIPLVLHGGSSSGEENLNKCATGGISKINIWTDFLENAKNKINQDGSTAYLDILKSEKDSYFDTLKNYYEVFETKAID